MLFCVLLNANDNMPTTVALLNLLYPVCCYCNEIAWHFFFWIVRFPSTYVCMYSMPCVSYNFRHSFFYTIRRILHIRCHLGFCWFGDISIPSYTFFVELYKPLICVTNLSCAYLLPFFWLVVVILIAFVNVLAINTFQMALHLI